MTTLTLPAIISFTGEYEFLSSFSKAGGMVPLEYHFQARKAAGQSGWTWVMAAQTPGEAKRRGRKVQARPDWDQVRRAVMLDLVLDKFSVPALRDLLAATRGRILIEGNSWGDDYWGAVPWAQRKGICPMWDEARLTGHNWLGRILMMVRDVTDPLS